MIKSNFSFDDLPEYIRQLNEKVDLLLELSKQERNFTDKPLDIKEAAKLVKLSVFTIYSLTRQNKIPYFKKPGTKRLWFHESELIDWLGGTYE